FDGTRSGLRDVAKGLPPDQIIVHVRAADRLNPRFIDAFATIPETAAAVVLDGWYIVDGAMVPFLQLAADPLHLANADATLGRFAVRAGAILSATEADHHLAPSAILARIAAQAFASGSQRLVHLPLPLV